MEEIDIRSWENPIIKKSYDWTLKLGEELEEIVLAGGWATYLQAGELGVKALPSLDIDFVALKSNFKNIEEYLLRNNFTPVSFRYIKYYLESQEGGLEEINLDESKKHLSHELREIYLDMIWDQKVSPMGFVHPYVKTIFDEYLYDKTKGINVVKPEVILSMKFLIEENKYRGQKQIKDLVDIYTLINAEKLDFEVFKLLHSQEGFNLDWVVEYFRENEEFLSSVVVNQLETVFDREEFLHNVREIRDSLEH